MKYYVIAGEASGDLHGGNLLREIRKLDASATIRAWGGDKMSAAGATLVKHYRDLAFMGFVEVVANLRTIFRNLAFCKEDITGFQPDVLVLIDYPGFNLRIAKWARDAGYRVIYYISPQVWAWKENRVKGIIRNVDAMFVILPFEQDFYKKWNFPVTYVGHPLVQVINSYRSSPEASSFRLAVADDQVVVAILPGSRKQEISKKLPIMLETTRAFPECRFVVARAPGIDDAFYAQMLAAYKNVMAITGETYALLSRANAAMVTSGTATLETALFGVPEVICYKGNAVSYQIARRLIKIKYICLVNLIMDREVVRELIQEALTAENLERELRLLLYDAGKRAQVQADYRELQALLGEGGDASANAAQLVVSHTKNGLMENLSAAQEFDRKNDHSR